MNIHRSLLACLVIAFTSAPSLKAQQEVGSTRFLFNDPSLPVERRVDDLVGRMTLEEKVEQMRDHAPAIPRLGLPKYDWWNEGLHGVAFSGYATNFPQVIGMAATWDTPLVHHMGVITSTEARAKYNDSIRHGQPEQFFGLTFWAPNINIFRDPRWGRGQETYGEDPYLTSRMAMSFITGMQGDDPKYLRVVSTPKHFAVHSGPEATRHQANVDVSPHDLEDTYLPAFRAAITEAHAQSIMCAYNSIDGAPACANSMLLQQHLRKDWHFDGYVVSDCAAVADVFNGHHYAPDMAHAAAAALKAGTDLECGFRNGQAFPALVDAVHQGIVKEAEIDVAVKRLFRARMRLGMFDPMDSFAYGRLHISENNTPEHRAVSLQAARESMTLLKNARGLLPLKSEPGRIVVVGPTAELVQSLQGNYNGPPPSPVYPLEGIEKRFGAKNVRYAAGAALAEGFAMPISHTALHPAAGTGDGLTGEYFSNLDFSGKPVLTRTDRLINFNWDKVVPVPGLQRNNYSVRWSGTIVPPGPGDYRIGVRVNYCYACENTEAFNLYLDGKLLVKNGARTGERGAVIEDTVHFNDTHLHEIRLDYIHHTGSAGIDLTWQAPAELLRDEAVATAKDADVIVAMVGLSPGLEGEEMPIKLDGFSGGDRTSIELPAVQQQLLEALGALHKPLIVVSENGSALALNWAAEHADAVLEAWYPGEEGGTAIAETLAGDNNPAGRLPLTFYRSIDQVPAFDNYAMTGRTYRYFDGQPLFRFGDGLSYSSFAYSNLKMPKELRAENSVRIEADVKNTGHRAGDEVAQLYLTQPSGFETPLRILAGFQRVHLDAGQTSHLVFSVERSVIAQVDKVGTRVLLPGEYLVSVGGGQPGGSSPEVHGRFKVAGTIPKN